MGSSGASCAQRLQFMRGSGQDCCSCAHIRPCEEHRSVPLRSPGRASRAGDMLVDSDSQLLSMWHRICKEPFWTEDSDTNAAARTGYIHNLPRAQLVRQLGKQVNLMRWLSFPRGERETRAFWTENCVILVMHALTVEASGSSAARQHVRTACHICIRSVATSCVYAQSSLAARTFVKPGRRIGILAQPMTKFYMQTLRTRESCQEFQLESCTWQHAS